MCAALISVLKAQGCESSKLRLHRSGYLSYYFMPTLSLFSFLHSPLGLVADGDQEKFDRLRGVEIKHGRICMLGVVGYLVTAAGIRLPGNISLDGTKFSDISSGWDGSFQVPVAGALQVLAFCGFLELAGWKQDESSFPGDFSASSFPVGWTGDYDEETKLDYRAKELNQGRAAQMGMLALMVHDAMGVSILPGGL